MLLRIETERPLMISSMSEIETSQTFSRGLDVLQLLASTPLGHTPSQLASELGLSRTIVYRLVNTLLAHRLVRRTAEGALVMAPGALPLTEHVLGSLGQMSRTILADLARESGAAAHFYVADGDDILAVAVEEPPFAALNLSYRVGSRTPQGRGAVGLAIAAASRGESEIFESEGKLVPGAHGIVASLPTLDGLPAAVGVVTLAGLETPEMRTSVLHAAHQLIEQFARQSRIR